MEILICLNHWDQALKDCLKKLQVAYIDIGDEITVFNVDSEGKYLKTISEEVLFSFQ